MILRVALCFSLVMFLLKADAQFKLAFFAGPQATSAKYIVRDSKQPADFKYGLMAGAGMKVDFDNQLYFFPSVYYSLKGYKVTLKDSAFPPSVQALNNDVTVHSIDICPMFHFDFNKKPSHFFLRLGPTIELAISGKEKFDSLGAGGAIKKVERPLKFSFTQYGRYTASANLHFGFESSKGFMIYGFYTHGIGSMNNADGGPKILHRVMGISFGWLIGHNPLVFDTRVKE